MNILKEKIENRTIDIVNINGKKITFPFIYISFLTSKDEMIEKLLKDNSRFVGLFHNIYTHNFKKPIFEKYPEYRDLLVCSDNGAFQFYKNKQPISVNDLINRYEKLKPDLGVTLDVIVNPNDNIETKKRKELITLNNAIKMRNFMREIDCIVPIHIVNDRRFMKAFIKLVLRKVDPRFMGIGAIVPISKKLSLFFSILQQYVNIIKKSRSDIVLHAFGLNSIKYIFELFLTGIDTFDSSSIIFKSIYHDFIIKNYNILRISIRSYMHHFNIDKKLAVKYIEDKLVKYNECNCYYCKKYSYSDLIIKCEENYNIILYHNLFNHIKFCKNLNKLVIDNDYKSILNLKNKVVLCGRSI